ncbi:porin family protein [Hymenobacter persicinus]|uniref:PorT family protein n=1 Tax=Hymenobacter persicinus TaxID=2025506 RepID=A0A4Q5LD03_9BACT|nr:porin family protein [Hymenobacter persicinus]RYU81035.1 PorT family protein [Hymenobacter persicinus]
MKNVTLFTALLLAAGTATAQTPGGTRLGLKAGATFSTFSGVINATPRPRTSFVLGTMLRLKPSSQGFAVQVEAQLSAQGTKLEDASAASSPTSASGTISLPYMNVPVLLRQYIGNVFYVNVGPQLGLLVGNKEGYKTLEGALVGGVGLETSGGLVLDARLLYGLTGINNDPAERAFRQRLGASGLYNRGGQLSVGYLFGSK